MPVNLKLGYNIKKTWINKEGEPQIDIESVVENLISSYTKKIKRSKKKEDSMMYG